MFSKKFNKSEELIFLGPNFLKIPEGKLTLKKSLPVLSPKASSKITSIKNLHKPAKKQNKMLSQNIVSMSSIPEIKSNHKIEAGGNKRSKSKVITSHLSGEKQREKQKEGWKNQLTRDRTEYPKVVSTARIMREEMSKNSLKAEEEEGEVDSEEKYKFLLTKCKKVLKTYSAQLKKAQREIEMLKEENSMLRKKNNN